jgi:hypothetical protein
LHEPAYTVWDTVKNLGFMPEIIDTESVEVVSDDSGKVVFDLHGSPRPYVVSLTVPALSPDGHKLAIIRHGFLEVFEVP